MNVTIKGKKSAHGRSPMDRGKGTIGMVRSERMGHGQVGERANERTSTAQQHVLSAQY